MTLKQAVPILAAIGLITTAGTAHAQMAATPTPGTHYPVTINICGSQPVVIEAQPQRVITTAPNITEYFLALGLLDKLVGQFSGDLPVSGYAALHDQVPEFGTDAFTLEQIVALKPDLVFAGFGFGFWAGTPITPDGLATRGIDALPLYGSCTYTKEGENQRAEAAAVGLQGDDLEATYQDIRNIGVIFQVTDKAEALIAEMRKTVDDVQAKIAGAERKSVFFFSQGEAAPGSAGGISTPNALIKLGGGNHIFDDLEEDYTTVSWEQVVAADPECILVKNGSNAGTRGEDSIAFLKASAITNGLRAIKNDCFYELNQDHLTPGPLNAWAVQAVAHWLHPDLVAEPGPAP